VLDLSRTEHVGPELDKKQIDDMIIAWAVAYTSNHGGNEVCLVKDAALIACAGGPSTVEAANMAIAKAEYLQHPAKGAVFAADAFFPFTDAPDLLLKAGISAGIVPKGGKSFEEVKQAFAAGDIGMRYLPEEYRGFCRH
jgi:phosphoribosylaminoimidazolecarboxamide formyltransferase/IMP cyclohydrolase